MANCADPDQGQFDLGLHCLLGHVCLNIMVKYDSDSEKVYFTQLVIMRSLQKEDTESKQGHKVVSPCKLKRK